VLEGEIKSRVKGGLIVDVSGVKGFLPGSQLDVVPVRNLDDYLGKRFEFKVMKIDRERRNIVLSRRDLIEQRRREKRKGLLTDIKVGQLRSGLVKNITDFGAFIDLGGLDGLLHITDMSWGRVSHPSKVLKVGETTEVVILGIDFDKERVSLGLKQKHQTRGQYRFEIPRGQSCARQGGQLVPYGAFVEIEEGVEGLVHVSEISWIQRVGRASTYSLSATKWMPWYSTLTGPTRKSRSASARPRPIRGHGAGEIPVGSRVKGIVRNFTSYGAFVELQEGIDGMIHVSDMSWTRKVNHPSEILKKADIVDVVVLEVDPSNQRISLGLKQAQNDPWSLIADRYKVGQKVTGKVSKLASFRRVHRPGGRD